MKKVISLLLMISIMITCSSIVTFAEESTVTIKQESESTGITLPKIRYYYTDECNDIVMTNNVQEFNDNITSDEQIEVVFELEYDVDDCDCKNSLDATSTDLEVEMVKMEHRNKMKEIHIRDNNEFLIDSGLSLSSESYTITMSEYSPFVQIVFDNFNDYQDYDLQIIGLADLDSVLGINIGVPLASGTTATRVNAASVGTYQMQDAIDDVNASSQTYDGSGVTVGIIEAYGVAYTYSDSELGSLNIHTIGTSSDTHAINVTRIFCGSNGLARNVDEVYIYHSPGSSTMISAMDWMVANGVDVINTSKSTPNLNGQYHWTSALLDYYIRYEFITYVNSAGNDGATSDSDTCNYGMGYNVIAVGATDVSNNISTYSSFGVDSGIYSRKPTISAPGTNIIIGGDNIGRGTSYSAPIVAGIIAKLMDEYAFLKVYPEVVVASIIASATPVNGQTSTWDDHAGSGRIDYQRAREAVSNYVSFSFSNDSVGNVRIAETLSGVTNKSIKVAAFWLVNSTTTNSSGEILLNNHTDYDLNITDADGEWITGSYSLKNIEIKSYDCGANSNIILQIEQYSERKTSDKEWGAFTWVYE